MTPEQKLKLIRDIVIENLTFYDAPINEIKVKMYAKDLSNLELENIQRAFSAFRLEKGRRMMPMPADIASFLSPTADSKDLARETALRIRHAVSKYGWSNSRDAQIYIGDTGWSVVERIGGWQHICENLGTEIQETTFMAQCRDAIESTINLGTLGLDPTRPSIEQSKRSGLTSTKDILSGLLEGKKPNGVP